MASEKEWVRSLIPRVQESLNACAADGGRVEVCTGERVAYAHEIFCYQGDGTTDSRSQSYETDLLIYDINGGNDWIPRVVLECKLGGVSTHDALTYSAKAATHKHVHPYLRYGILIGNLDDALPGRLIRHGAFFDFMMVWPAEEPSAEEWSYLGKVLADEVRASRHLQDMLTTSRLRTRKRFRLLHRPLVLVGSGQEEAPTPSGQDKASGPILPADQAPEVLDDA